MYIKVYQRKKFRMKSTLEVPKVTIEIVLFNLLVMYAYNYHVNIFQHLLHQVEIGFNTFFLLITDFQILLFYYVISG